MQYFIAVAENGGFTKAAKHCYVSQTAISQQIASMEHELEVSLFDRKPYGVELTPAGSSFLKDCKAIVEIYESAVEKARALSKRLEGILRIGVTGPGEQYFLPQIISNFQEKYPNVELNIKQDSLVGLIEKLKTNVLDVIFTFAYDNELVDELDRITVLRDEVGLVVSKHHRLAEFDQIEALEVANEKIIMISKEFGPKNYEHMVECCRKDGYDPNIVATADSLDVLMLMVAANKGVAFLPKRNIDTFNNTVHFVKINGTHHSNEIELAWKKDDKNPIVETFVKVAKVYCKS